jgi:acyl-CoA thioester hydrolase
VTLGAQVTIVLHLNGYSTDGSHWRFQQKVLKASGQVAATVEVEGGWLDLRARRFMAPPAELLTLLESLRQPENVEELPSLVKSRG